MARVFISHSSRDNESAERIKIWLAEQGFDTPFLDYDKHAGIPPGADWEKTLYLEIERSEAVVIIQTPNWLDSKWCFAEFTQARALGKSIFPIIETPAGDTLISSDIQVLDLLKDREGGLEQLSSQLTQIALDAQGGFGWDASRPPYPGLLAFQEEDAALYFGRDDDIRRLIERLDARRAQGGSKLIALLGSSGSGKSSLLRAGVIPRLKRAGRNWVVLPAMRPQVRPVDELARCLAVAYGTDGNESTDWRKLREALNGDNLAQSLSDIANDLRMRASANEAQILLPIDQGEELFGAADSDQAKRFCEILNVALSSDLPFIAVIAMRSDYLGLLQSAEHLNARFEEFSLGPLPVARIAQIIEGPARVAGLGIDEAFVHQAVKDAKTEDALPLLAFALRELYDSAAGDNYLSLAEYNALGDAKEGLTPLENAVRKAADNVLTEARPGDEELTALREAFVPAMVRVNDQGEYVRQPARWDDLPNKSHALLEQLAKARLLIVSQDGDDRMIEVAHEALLRKWPRLRTWLDDARGFLAGKQQLERDLNDWEQADEKDKTGALLTGLKLSRVHGWFLERPHQFSAKELAFVQASIDRAEAAERRKQKLRRNITLASIVASLILACATSFSLYQWVETEKALKISQANRLAFVAKELLEDGDSTRALRVGQAAYAINPRNVPYSVKNILQKGQAYVVSNKIGLYKNILRHKDKVNYALFSPDASKLVTVSDDGSAKLWDRFGVLLNEMKNTNETGGAPEKITHATFTHDGKKIITVGYGHLVKMWDAEGNYISDLIGHGCGQVNNFCDVKKVATSSDGKTIVTVSSDKRVIMWDGEGEKIKQLNEHLSLNGWINTVAFSSDGKHFATAGGDWDTSVQLYTGRGNHIASLQQDKCPKDREDHWNCGTFDIAFSPEENFFLTASDSGTIRMFDLEGNLLKALKKHSARVSSLKFSPDGLFFLSASNDKTAILWNKDGSIKKKLEGHTEAVTSAVFSPDGKYIATSSNDKTSRLWDLEGNMLVKFEGHKADVTSVNFSKDGKYILTASGDKTGLLWNVLPENPSVLKHDGEVVSAQFLPDGKRVLTASNDMSVRLWNVDSTKVLKTYEGFGPDRYNNRRIFSLDISPNGKRFITTGTDYTIRIWDVETGTVVQTTEAKTNNPCNASGWCGAKNARYSFDGQYIITSDLGGSVEILDSEGSLLKTILSYKQGGNEDGHRDEVNGIDISRDNGAIVTGSHDNTIKLWDFKTGRLLKTLEGHSKPISSVHFSPKGDQILSASHDQTVKLWNLNGDILLDIEAHTGQVSSAEFSPTGENIISSSFDKTVKIWNLEGNLVRSINKHKKYLRSAFLSPNGDKIISASGDNTAVIWPNLSPRKVYGWVNAQDIYTLTSEERKEIGIDDD
jgi:WD40 repeat protein